MKQRAPAKLNLFLHITGKRPDGYHDLHSLVCFISLADTLAFHPADTLSLEIKGPFAPHVSAQDNLVLRAARALSPTKGARISLSKHIPVGAGLGGGSSDAAATLLALNKFWNLNVPMHTLETIAQTLGSDVPACLYHTPQMMSGTGHVLSPATIPDNLAAVLVYPNTPLATQAVYAHVAIPTLAPQHWDWKADRMIDSLRAARNDLEPAAFKLMPELQSILAQISDTDGCLLARMSGSGSTCFGLYENIESAQASADKLKRQTSHFIVPCTVFSTPPENVVFPHNIY